LKPTGLLDQERDGSLTAFVSPTSFNESAVTIFLEACSVSNNLKKFDWGVGFLSRLFSYLRFRIDDCVV
jgi:hypothetical protein